MLDDAKASNTSMHAASLIYYKHKTSLVLYKNTSYACILCSGIYTRTYGIALHAMPNIYAQL